jgi:hypothetical protein
MAAILQSMTCSEQQYTPTKRAEEDRAVTALLEFLDNTRPLTNDVRFASHAQPWKVQPPPTCVVARRSDGTPVGFLSGRLTRRGSDYNLPGTVGFIVLVGTLRGHGCAAPDGPTLGERLVNYFTRLATDAGSQHLVLRVGASATEDEHTKAFFDRLRFMPLPDSSGQLWRPIEG